MATPHFNFTVAEPMGVVGILAPDEAPLLALLSLILPAICSGNSVAAMASPAHPLPSTLLGEMLAVSDLPGGVVNLLTGHREELLPTFATHAHLHALAAVADPDEQRELQLGTADSVKRLKLIPTAENTDWLADSSQGLE